jgi:hypothetical protein
MWRQFTLALLLTGASAAVTAQTAPAASATATPAKKELVQKVLSLQQGSVEGLARALAEQPAMQVLQLVGPQIQNRVPADKREALARDIQSDARKYVDEAFPLVRERALKLAPTVVGPLLEEKFTEDELKTLAAFLESPAIRKYQQLAPEMQRALADKLVADSKPTIEPKVRALEQSVSRRLDAALAGPAAAGSGPTAAKPASAAKK